MFSRETRYLLAAIQAILSWEWITSGMNKVLSGNFPQTLGDTLSGGFKDNPNGWYISFLQRVVEPHSVFYGYLIEWSEVTVGIVLLLGVLLLLGIFNKAPSRLSVSLYALVAIVAVIGAFLCINFHFWMGKSLMPGMGADPGDEGIDLDALMPPLSLVIMVANLYIISRLKNITLFTRQKVKTDSSLS